MTFTIEVGQRWHKPEYKYPAESRVVTAILLGGGNPTVKFLWNDIEPRGCSEAVFRAWVNPPASAQDTQAELVVRPED